MSDLISREDAIEEIARRDTTDGTVKVFSGREIIDLLNDLPAESKEEYVKIDWKIGKWIRLTKRNTWYYACSECHAKPLLNEWNKERELSNYCPHCGARMETEGGEG